ncbi:MAG: hypothetical protein QXE81_04470 [Desulfurococcaceae archaeon]
MTLLIKVRCRDNYWRYTVYSWLLEIRDLLVSELGEEIKVLIQDSDSDEPEIYLNDTLVGRGVPGEEGYLIEYIKKTYYETRKKRSFID